MILKKKFIALNLFLFLLNTAIGQIHCGLVELDPNTTESTLLTFDDFTSYSGGITVTSVARLRVRVEHQAVVDPLCSWSLTMTVENGGVATPIDEWEELLQYGSGAAINPAISILQVRIRNTCATSPIDGIFQTFTNDGDLIDIIEPLLAVTPAGSCALNVNGPGSYLTNYDEYNFDVDIRVVPGFDYNPGIYQLNVRFRLEENP